MANKSVTDQYKSRIASLNKTVAKNASKGVTNRTVKTPSTISGATRPTGTATKKTGVANSKTPTMSSYAGGAVSGGLGSKVSRPLTSSKMRANPRPTNPKAVTQHMASKSKKYTY